MVVGGWKEKMKERKGRIKRREKGGEEERGEKERREYTEKHGERGREESRGQAGPACCPGVPTAG